MNNSDAQLANYSQDDEPDPSQLSGDENAERKIEEKGPDRRANLLLTVTTIIKTIVGAGILSFPYTFSRLGYLFAILMFFVIIVLTQFTVGLIMKSKNLSRHSNFSTIIYGLFPNRFIQILPSLSIFSALFGTCIIQLMILKDSLKQILDEMIQVQWVKEQFYTSATFIVLLIALLQIRFILIKKIQNYKFVAFIGVCGVSSYVICLFIIIIMEMNKRQAGHKCHSDFKPFESDFLGIASVLPNYIFSFTYQWNFFPIYKGMKNVTDKRLKIASYFGLTGCALLYGFAGIMGYCMYGREVKSNFLLSLNIHKMNAAIYYILKFCYLISVFIAYPILIFGARSHSRSIYKTIKTIYRGRRNRNENSESLLSQETDEILTVNEETENKKQFYIVTFALHIIITIFSIVFKDIQDVVNVIGAISASAISFWFPGIFYFTLVKRMKKPKKISYYLSYLLLIFFVPFGFFAVAANYIA